MKRITVSIGKYELDHGIPGSETMCPAALALWWRIPGHKRVHGDGLVTVHPIPFKVFRIPGMRNALMRKQVPDLSREIARFQLPPEIVEWMRAYDETGKAEPVEFAVDAPVIGGSNVYED